MSDEKEYMNITGPPMRESIRMALDELGEPQPDYPVPVANAVGILRDALANWPSLPYEPSSPLTGERVKGDGCGVWHRPNDPCPGNGEEYFPEVDAAAIRAASMCYAAGPGVSPENVTRNIVEVYLCRVHEPPTGEPTLDDVIRWLGAEAEQWRGHTGPDAHYPLTAHSYLTV